MGKKLDIEGVIILARKHVISRTCEMQSSAELCLQDAMALFEDGEYAKAAARSLKSLAYTVGITHTDYKRVRAWMVKRGYAE